MIDRAEERAIARDPLTIRLNRELIACFARHEFPPATRDSGPGEPTPTRQPDAPTSG